MSTVLTWEDDSGALVSMVFDVDNQETHDLQTEVTEYPVEDGADVADNARDQLETFTLEAYIGEKVLPFNVDVFERVVLKTVELQIPERPLVASASALVGAAAKSIGSALFGGPPPVRAQMYTLDLARSRKKAALDLINDARKKRRLLRILTSMKDYENMLITGINVTRSPSDGDGATFTIVFKEVHFVESEITSAPKPSEPIGATKKSSGSKNAADDKTGKAGEKRESVLSAILNGRNPLAAVPGL